MKGYKKNLFIVLLVILGVLTSAASAFGASKLKDDIKLSVTTDKDTYAKGESVRLDISLYNNSKDTVIEDITIKPTIPEALKDILIGDVKEFKIPKLEPQSSKAMETIKFESSQKAEEKETETESEPAEKKEEKEEKKETLPATGESNKILYLGLALILIGVMLFIVLKFGKKSSGILSMFIVAFLIIGLFPIAALADTGDDYETVEGSTTITVDGKEYTISAIASFKVAAEDVEEPEEDVEEPEEDVEEPEEEVEESEEEQEEPVEQEDNDNEEDELEIFDIFEYDFDSSTEEEHTLIINLNDHNNPDLDLDNLQVGTIIRLLEYTNNEEYAGMILKIIKRPDEEGIITEYAFICVEYELYE